jgi:hypothetical protein
MANTPVQLQRAHRSRHCSPPMRKHPNNYILQNGKTFYFKLK